MAASVELVRDFIATEVKAVVPLTEAGRRFKPAPGNEPIERGPFDDKSTRTFRVVEQHDLDVVRPYGGIAMEHSQTLAVRAVYLVAKDGDKRLRQMIAEDRELIVNRVVRAGAPFPAVLVNIVPVPGPGPQDVGTGGANVQIATIPFLVTYDTVP